MKKKLLCRICAFLLICSMLPLPASAAENDVEIICNDENLYAALTDALNGVADYDAAPDAKRLTLSKTEAAKVTSLTLNNREIADLSGLGAFPALQELDISNNAPITDLSPLSSLTGLTSLNAYGNAVSDLSPILGLTALESLNLGKNRLNESKSSSENCVTEQLSVLTNLKTLDLSHNVIRYTAGLNRLTALQSLNLYDNAIRDLSGLEGLANLEFLSLGENNETNTTAVILPEDSQEPLFVIPNGAFRVQAEVSFGGSDMTGASLWFAGYSQEGKLLEIQSREISDLASVTFLVENGEGRVQNAKVFLLSGQFAPLSASADIG